MLTLENIDRAIFWYLKDKVIKTGRWPNERAFIAANDQVGFDAALAAIPEDDRIDVFSVGNFKDRSELKKNNIIISRTAVYGGSVGYAHPFEFQLNSDLTYDKLVTPEASKNIDYEIRFVCDNVKLDRIINMLVQMDRVSIFGITDDDNLTNLSESFWLFSTGEPADLSDGDYIERVFMFTVSDVILDEGLGTAEENIPAAKEIGLVENIGPRGYDVQYPDAGNDVLSVSQRPFDYFHGLVHDLAAWNKMFSARLYTRNTEAEALVDILNPNSVAVNLGLTFFPFRGYRKSAIGQYLNTRRNAASQFNLTSYSYMIWVGEAPAGQILDLFGIQDSSQGYTSFLLQRDLTNIIAQGNSTDDLSVAREIKPNTLYTLNRRDRFVMELYEGDDVIGFLQEEPTLIPNGNIYELNIGDENGTAIGDSTSGSILFSACGAGLKGIEIKEFNREITKYMRKIGVIS